MDLFVEVHGGLGLNVASLSTATTTPGADAWRMMRIRMHEVYEHRDYVKRVLACLLAS